MNNYSAQSALDRLDGHLLQALGIRRRHDASRTKAQIFEVPGSGKQFALMLGDRDETTGKFLRQEVRLVLEDDVPQGLPDVRSLPKSDQLASSALNDTKWSRLKVPNQRSAVVTSDLGLQSLLQWYSGKTATTSASTSSDEKKTLQEATAMVSLGHTLATNTILYGPPGTGKTYATTAHAVRICDGELPGDGGAAAVRRRFEDLRQQGRVSFVTFHQSYGYEEFVEGLRPQSTDDGQVVYNVTPGAFMRSCNSAGLRRMVTPGLAGMQLMDRTVFKMSLGASWNSQGTTIFEYCLKRQCVLLGWGYDIDFTECADKAAIEAKVVQDAPDIKKLSSHVWFLDYFKHEMKVGDLIVVSQGSQQFRGIAEVTGDYEFAEDAPFHQMRAVKWLAVFEGGRPADEIYSKEIGSSTLFKLNPKAIRYEQLQELLTAQVTDGPAQPHVLIIDEINRANISKVFGELITLIEPDKREGQANAVTVKLPYSGEDFSVPANLHLVGTMNTADRSIALLDTALRRRFDFIEVVPDPNVLKDVKPDGIDLTKLLTSLNQRIEVLYDRDHTIGHAYFMGVESLDDLERVFRRKVLPLLQEYFFENWSKVRRVLNDLGDGDFVRKTTRQAIPADGEDELTEEVSVVYSVNPAPFPVEAYLRIYAGK